MHKLVEWTRRSLYETTSWPRSACWKLRYDTRFRIFSISSSVVNSMAVDNHTETKKAQETLVAACGISQVVLRPTLMFGWFDRKHIGWLARFMSIQSIHAGIKEARLPAADGRRRSPKLPLDGVERCTLSQHQNQPGAKHISSGQRTRLGDAAQFHTLLFAQQHIIGWHECFDANSTSNVYSETSHPPWADHFTNFSMGWIGLSQLRAVST
jgi:hypothetical protein